MLFLNDVGVDWVGLYIGEEGMFELFLSYGSEFVDSHPVGLSGFGVVLIDCLQVLLKDLESVGLLLSREIKHQSMLLFPLCEDFFYCLILLCVK